MQKFTKALAAIMLMTATLFVAGCEKDKIDSKDATYALIEDYVNEMDAVFTKDGYVALFGALPCDDTSISNDFYNRYIYIAKIDTVCGIIDTTMEVSILIDSLNNPAILTTKDYTILFSNVTENTFDYVFIQGDDIQEYQSISFSLSERGKKKSLSSRKDDIASSGDRPLLGLNDLLDAIGKGQTMYSMITATTNGEKIAAGLGAIASAIGGKAGLTLDIIGDAMLRASLSTSLLGIAALMWYENQKFILRHIGPWKISIQSVEQIGRRLCKVNYEIDGIISQEGNPMVQLYFQRSDRNRHNHGMERIVNLGKAVNGAHEVVVDNLEAGYYLVWMKILDECHRSTGLSITTHPMIFINMFDLGLDHYSIGDNPVVQTNTVNYHLDVFIDGNEESLLDIDEFGFYVKYANDYDYRPVPHLSTIFQTTPSTYTLSVDKTAFREGAQRVARGYYIGVYVVRNNRNLIEHFDEQEIEGLVYPNEVDWIDLGLPSGLLWATCNIGATSPEDYGDYFAWGETEPKESYFWGNYRYCSGYDDEDPNIGDYLPDLITKYNQSDHLIYLEHNDDAATINWGEGARTPTNTEWNELKSRTTSQWTTVNGVFGMRFTGRNGNSIFLPATGFMFGRWVYVFADYGDNTGCYWSNGLSTYDILDASLFVFGSDRKGFSSIDRCLGLPVRAVRQN